MTAGLSISPTPQRHQLLWFVLVSLALHGAGLAGWQAARPVTLGETVSASENITLQAVLTQPEPVTEQKTEQQTPVESKPQKQHTTVSAQAKVDSRTSHKLVEKTDTATARTSPVLPPSKETQQVASATEDGAPAQKSTTAILNESERLRLLGRIRLALADHFRYPLQARRLGWQGEVVLAFRLEADGRILDARIARSSGYRVLDHAALDALDKVKGMRHEGQRGINLQLPVIYRLEG